MILIGQYDSPFVRRVGIALRLYDMAFEHRAWSIFSNADQVQGFNPLIRVPNLILDDGDVLIDSAVIIDYLDRTARKDQVLFPRHEPARHRALKVAALACGLADKAVSLFYERTLHDKASAIWEQRCLSQIAATLAVLETDRAALSTPWWFGEKPGHADIAVACVLRHATEAHPGTITLFPYPALAAHAAASEALPVFLATQQAFIPPA